MCLGLLLIISSLPAQSLGIEDLERKLLREPPVVTPFVEFRFSRLMKSAARTSGTLEYLGAGLLTRTVTAPYSEHAEIAGDEVRIRRGNREVRRVSLQRVPQLRVLLGGFRAMLDGKIEALKGDFTVTVGGRDESWNLTLRPRDPRIARNLERIEVHGAADRPRCFEIVEPDGDSTLTFLDVAPDRKISARAELSQLCRAGVAREPGHDR